MIEPTPTLTSAERRALTTLLSRTLAAGEPPVLRAFLFGSKARGDFDAHSDVDLLLVCDIDPDEREYAGRLMARDALVVRRETGVVVEPWAVTAADLVEGYRTPMLIDALDDGHPLWPLGATPLPLPFTPADALFCASCLLDWVEAGGPIVREALENERWGEAAARARDDITRIATAALLLTGDTRHRRISSLERFAERFVHTRRLPLHLLPALDWAAAAYPPGGGRGAERPPATPTAILTAPRGYQLAQRMEAEVVPYLIERIFS
jgi:predicted nucleotidyltransferase